MGERIKHGGDYTEISGSQNYHHPADPEITKHYAQAEADYQTAVYRILMRREDGEIDIFSPDNQMLVEQVLNVLPDDISKDWIPKGYRFRSADPILEDMDALYRAAAIQNQLIEGQLENNIPRERKNAPARGKLSSLIPVGKYYKSIADAADTYVQVVPPLLIYAFKSGILGMKDLLAFTVRDESAANKSIRSIITATHTLMKLNLDHIRYHAATYDFLKNQFYFDSEGILKLRADSFVAHTRGVMLTERKQRAALRNKLLRDLLETPMVDEQGGITYPKNRCSEQAQAYLTYLAEILSGLSLESTITLGSTTITIREILESRDFIDNIDFTYLEEVSLAKLPTRFTELKQILPLLKDGTMLKWHMIGIIMNERTDELTHSITTYPTLKCPAHNFMDPEATSSTQERIRIVDRQYYDFLSILKIMEILKQRHQQS